MQWILALVLVTPGCRWPDSWGVSVGYTETDHEINRSNFQGIAGGAASIVVTPTWLSGEHLARLKREEARDKREEFLLVQEAVAHGFELPPQDEAEEEDEDEHFPIPIPDIPETDEEANILLKYAGAIAIVILALAAASLAGLRIPYLSKKDKEPKE